MNKGIRSSSSFVVAITLLGLLALPVLAAPSQTPPGGNVDASFNSLTASFGTVGGLSIAASGALSNGTSQNLGMVQVYDPNGFALATDSSSLNSFQVSGAGNISNVGSLHSGNVQIADSQGLSIADDSGAAGLLLKQDGTVANVGSLNNGDFVVNDALTVTGHAKASSGFGKVVKRSGSASANILSAGSGSSIANCAAGEILMSCGYSGTTGDVNVYQLTTNGDTVTAPTTCTATAKNLGSVTATVTAYAVCWNGNS